MTHWFYVDTLHTPISCQVEAELTSKWLRRIISIKFPSDLCHQLWKQTLGVSELVNPRQGMTNAQNSCDCCNDVLSTWLSLWNRCNITGLIKK